MSGTDQSANYFIAIFHINFIPLKQEVVFPHLNLIPASETLFQYNDLPC